MSNQPIYLDYAATTPVDPRVVDSMTECLGLHGTFGNPASNTHSYGFFAKEKVDESRQTIADALNCDPREVVFTSGATEANNLAIKGISEQHCKKGRHVITVATEHKAVLDPCEYLASHGFEVTVLPVQSNGLIDLDELKNALREDTVLVSVMWVNNETGVVQDIPAIAGLVKANGSFFHVDAAQAIGKLPIDLKTVPIDLLSICAHKIYGPKGIGALYVRRRPRVTLVPQIQGGGHEQGMRSGTLPTHQIVGLAESIRLAVQVMDEETTRISDFKNRLWQGISKLPKVKINGDLNHSVCGILNVCFEGCDGEALVTALDGIAISSGSACTSATVEPSHVLNAMGVSNVDADSSLRISIGRFTVDTDIDFAIELIKTQVTRLRSMSPAWSDK